MVRSKHDRAALNWRPITADVALENLRECFRNLRARHSMKPFVIGEELKRTNTNSDGQCYPGHEDDQT
jgi:hypothetical protein